MLWLFLLFANPVTVDTGATLEYKQSGSGPVLVLIGGWGASYALFEAIRPQLDTQFTVIAFNNRGIGNSTDPGGTYSVAAMADDTAGLMKKLGYEKYHVLGISLGGFVAQDLAHRYPDVVNKLILVSTSLGGPQHVAPSAEVMQFFASVNQMPLEERVRKGLAMALHPSYVQGKPEAMEHLVANGVANPADPQILGKQTMAAMFFDFSQKAAEIRTPTLVLHGADDRIVVSANGKKVAGAIPNATLINLEESGHLPILDQTKQTAKHITTFLKQ